MHTILEHFLRWFRFETPEKHRARLSRLSVASTFKVCPFCGGPLKGHWYSDLAFAAVGSREDIKAIEFANKHDWRALHSLQAADMQSDLHIWRALKCPTGGLAVAMLMSPYEFSLRDNILEMIVVSAAAHDQIEAAVSDRWIEL